VVREYGLVDNNDLAFDTPHKLPFLVSSNCMGVCQPLVNKII